MTRADIFIGLLMAAGFGVVLWDASSFIYGTEFAPGPGFAPVWLSIIGIILALLISANARRKGDGEVKEAEVLDKPGLVRVGITLLGLVVTLYVEATLGLLTALFVFLLFLTLGVQRLSVVKGICASLGTCAFLYVVFIHFLNVPVPTGPLGF